MSSRECPDTPTEEQRKNLYEAQKARSIGQMGSDEREVAKDRSSKETTRHEFR
jgi:hypothetical protein